MQYKQLNWSAALLALPFATAQTWGPVVGLGPTADGVTITSVVATIYPGAPPASQAGGLYSWIGIDNEDETGDLIQGIVGQYIAGESECQGTNRDTEWCISAEVYGLAVGSTEDYAQYVGTKLTLDATPAHGITFTYNLTDSTTKSWTQTARDAVTGTLLATFTKISDYDFVRINTAVECADCTAPISAQTWQNITIGLSGADAAFGKTIFQSNSATNTAPVTADKGKTWTIAKINVPVVTPIAD
ncbi:hypothetical protein LTR36_009002 [Oleoguttula mirabilis]|uniref:Uncharacterized protein n=1 Tax=Oleoguttula mirabilis TaxID=1507867 RepID=A0AAV9J6Z5_9PEZI|nr:hypothetical protein LTR36_009002 [Oleoguttula mirabilis]